RQAARASSCERLEPAVSLDRLLTSRTDVSSNLLERRAPSSLSRLFFRRNTVDIVGTDGQRYLSQLRAVQRPINLNRCNVVDDQSRQRNPLDVIVARRWHRGIHAARKR